MISIGKETTEVIVKIVDNLFFYLIHVLERLVRQSVVLIL